MMRLLAMGTLRKTAILLLVMTLITILMVQAVPARANVTALQLTRRTCGYVNAFAVYDGFSEGTPVFYVAFAVDLNENGVHGEAGEPIKFVRVASTTEGQRYVGTFMRWDPPAEGTKISVTSYELDSAGRAVSKQIEPVRYECTNRPATDTLPQNIGDPRAPVLRVQAKVNVDRVTVYSKATVKSEPLGGLGKGATVSALALNRRGDWVQVEYNGTLGWIMWPTQMLMLGPYRSLPKLPNAEDAK